MDRSRSTTALKALYATGLFADVHINHAGGRLVVTVVENPVINQVAFEGNKKAKDDQLKVEVQSKPRGTLSKPTVQADVQRIVEIYHRSGRFDVSVVPKIIELPNNRVNLVFEIHEGDKTGVKEIRFIGAHHFSSGRLKDVIKTRETNFLSFLQTTDIYDPDRVEADRDLIRRFYLKNGYADVRVLSAVGEYDPAKKGFIITFTIDEGAQYHVGTVDVVSNVQALNPNTLRNRLLIKRGLGLQRRSGREERRGHDGRGGQARLRLRQCAAARRPQCADADHQSGIRGRGRHARLYRAHQYPRQHAHARLRHPPRVRYRRRRRL